MSNQTVELGILLMCSTLSVARERSEWQVAPGMLSFIHFLVFLPRLDLFANLFNILTAQDTKGLLQGLPPPEVEVFCAHGSQVCSFPYKSIKSVLSNVYFWKFRIMFVMSLALALKVCKNISC